MGKTTFKLSEEDKQKIVTLSNKGYMDTEIAKQLSVSASAIYYWRKRLNIKSKFDYSKVSKIDNEKFLELFNIGLSDYAIAKELNMSPDGVYSHRMRHNYIRTKDLRYNESIKLTQFQLEVLIGTILGDSSFRCSNMNPSVSCAHGIKQKEYCEYKTSIFQNLGAKCTYHKRKLPDYRNGIYYEDYTMFVPANPEFLELYKSFYKNNKKIIPINILDNFTEVSLAFMYMDDGYKTPCGYAISTNCFERNNIEEFAQFLYSKWGLETSIHKNNVLYIKANSRALFKYLVSPYICKCVKYKL